MKEQRLVIGATEINALLQSGEGWSVVFGTLNTSTLREWAYYAVLERKVPKPNATPNTVTPGAVEKIEREILDTVDRLYRNNPGTLHTAILRLAVELAEARYYAKKAGK